MALSAPGRALARALVRGGLTVITLIPAILHALNDETFGSIVIVLAQGGVVLAGLRQLMNAPRIDAGLTRLGIGHGEPPPRKEHRMAIREPKEQRIDLGAEGRPRGRREDRRKARRENRFPRHGERRSWQERAQVRPNVLIIVSDDLGAWDLSCYHRGIMGTDTPNIDRIADEGVLFTDGYAQASCTAGRAALITGQLPMRTGLTMVGLPGAPEGLQKVDPTLAEMLKPLGYRTCQTGKNHLGDRNEHLPTVHGFDQFLGNLYHLNAEEEPEQPDYPKDSEMFESMFGPRGVLRCKATNRDDTTVTDPRFGPIGKQTIEDLGPLTSKWMETVEEDLLKHSLDFIDDAVKADEPFFVWHNTTRMHVNTHLSEKWDGKTGYGLYADGVQELDYVVGKLLDKLDDKGIADNTIIYLVSDNGGSSVVWPDGGTDPWRGEKGLGWEGGFRIPYLMRYPDVVEGGQVLNGIISLEDIVPTVMAAVTGNEDFNQQLLDGTFEANGTTYKVHLDGYNQLSYVTGEADESPRKEFFYFGESNLFAIRYQDWKAHYQMKDDWFAGATVTPKVPQPVNLRVDPFEYHMQSPGYQKYSGEKLWTLMPAAAIVTTLMNTFTEYPPSQPVAGFDPQEILEEMLEATAQRYGD